MRKAFDGGDRAEHRCRRNLKQVPLSLSLQKAPASKTKQTTVRVTTKCFETGLCYKPYLLAFFLLLLSTTYVLYLLGEGMHASA